MRHEITFVGEITDKLPFRFGNTPPEYPYLNAFIEEFTDQDEVGSNQLKVA